MLDDIVNAAGGLDRWQADTRWYFRAPAREIRAVLGHLAGLMADGQLHVPIEANYQLNDYRKAFQHAQTTQRGGKVLFTFD